MLYPEGLMHRKINIGLALLVIFTIAGIFAWIISARAVSLPGVGLNIVSIPLKCILDPPAEVTCSNCQTCTLLGSLCGAVSEVKVKLGPWSGPGAFQVLIGPGGPALCLVNPVPPILAPSPSFTPGSFCLGNILFTPVGHILSNFGCSF